MSEVKLNLVDNQQVLHGTIHGSVADACVAALSAEPETIAELSAALARYIKPLDDRCPFATFRSAAHASVHTALSSFPHSLPIDKEPWDAGIVVIDVAARIVATESTYSMPDSVGHIHYHDGTKSTDIALPYRLPDDWLFVNSVESYQWSRERRVRQRLANAPLDARKVLYGAPLLEFIINEVEKIEIPALRKDVGNPAANGDNSDETSDSDEAAEGALGKAISDIHARWLMTPRKDLRGQSPRDVLFERRDFIDSDLENRSLQWSLLDEGPPCLSPHSFAYRFAGFGTHEWVIYYDLIRYLLWAAATDGLTPFSVPPLSSTPSFGDGELAPQTVAQTLKAQTEALAPQVRETFIAQLEALKSAWLEEPQPDYDGRTPAILIDNERKRLPIALRPRDMIIDDDCPFCQMLGDETSPLGMGVGFWHLDGSSMDEGFVFSWCRTREEWEAEMQAWEKSDREFERRMAERQERIDRGELDENDPVLELDPFPGLDLNESRLIFHESNDDDEKDLPQ
jgi:hypothetical protein